MKKIIFFILSVFTVFTLLCDFVMAGSNIKGKVIDPFGYPVKGIKVIATTQTDIEEEQNKKQIMAVTNTNGEFLLKGGLEGKGYKIDILKEGYTSSEVNEYFPGKGKTRLLKPMYIFKSPPPGFGAFIVGENGSLMRLPGKHDMYLTFLKTDVPIINNTNLVVIQTGEGYCTPYLLTLQPTVLQQTEEQKETIKFKSGGRINGEVIEVGRTSDSKKISIIKAKIPLSKETKYYGVYDGFCWRTIYVFGVEEK